MKGIAAIDPRKTAASKIFTPGENRVTPISLSAASSRLMSIFGGIA
jgi:hypothetical protein